MVGAASTALQDLVAAEALAPVDPRVTAAAEALLARCDRRRVCGILFYGAGMWRGIAADTILDLYLVLDTPRAAGQGPVAAALNRLLPPNVIYLEVPAPNPAAAGPVRAKVALITLGQFRRGARGRAASPLIWARFAQPCRLVHARDAEARAAILGALADSVVSFHRKLLPLLPDQVTVPELWRLGLAETYARELRSEAAGRARAIIEAAPAALPARTRAALPLTALAARIGDDDGITARIGPWPRRRARAAARLARPTGKALSLARLMKGAFTFGGGVDYICAKVARHSGVQVEPSPRQRRHPLIFGWPLLWRIYRRGGFR